MQAMGCPPIFNKNAQNPAVIFVDRDGPAMLQFTHQVVIFCARTHQEVCHYEIP